MRDSAAGFPNLRPLFAPCRHRPHSDRRRLPARRSVAVVLATGMVLGGAIRTVAQPYTPVSDDEVIERLPPGLRGADFRRQREALAADPDNLRDSLAMAESYLETAQTEADPRFLGYAQAMLAPWWDQASPPVAVLVCRARVRTLTAEFDRALLDLEEALAREPGHLAALRLRFDVELARGDFDAARGTLEIAGPTVTPLVRAVMAARWERMKGPAGPVHQALEMALAAAGDVDVRERHAALALLADLDRQLGRAAEARQRFAALRRLGHREVAQLAAEADVLLDQGDPGGVLTLLQAEPPHDLLELRIAEALARLPSPDPAQVERREVLTRQLAARSDARRRRGEATGLAEEIRVRLRLTGEFDRARTRAGELWAIRRELEDVRWILEAAAAAGDERLARPVIAWLEARRIEDARLEPARQALADRNTPP